MTLSFSCRRAGRDRPHGRCNAATPDRRYQSSLNPSIYIVTPTDGPSDLAGKRSLSSIFFGPTGRMGSGVDFRDKGRNARTCRLLWVRSRREWFAILSIANIARAAFDTDLASRRFFESPCRRTQRSAEFTHVTRIFVGRPTNRSEAALASRGCGYESCNGYLWPVRVVATGLGR